MSKELINNYHCNICSEEFYLNDNNKHICPYCKSVEITFIGVLYE